MSERPVDAITQAEAAQILGCHIRTVGTYLTAGRLHPAAKAMHRALSRADVEELAREVHDWPRRM
jgi:DNA-directed RNA polymerase specialized sigma24 family protein